MNNSANTNRTDRVVVGTVIATGRRTEMEQVASDFNSSDELWAGYAVCRFRAGAGWHVWVRGMDSEVAR